MNCRACGAMLGRRQYKYCSLECSHRGRAVHGAKDTTEYEIWSGIIKRCENPRSRYFPLYGGRGIRIAPEWRHDFGAFLRHVGSRPSPDHSIDRIDNDGNYEPGNVRWATSQEQVRNSRAVRFVIVSGERMIQRDAARMLNCSPALITKMVQRGDIKRA